MLFGIGKKKPIEDPPAPRLRKGEGGEEGEKKQRRKSQKETGSRWAAVWLLVITLGLGIVFWVYGRLVGNHGSESESFGSTTSGTKQVIPNDQGKIIFEKKPMEINERKPDEDGQSVIPDGSLDQGQQPTDQVETNQSKSEMVF